MAFHNDKLQQALGPADLQLAQAYGPGLGAPLSQTNPVPVPPAVQAMRRASHAYKPNVDAKWPPTMQDTLQSMIEAHRSVITALETALALAHMADKLEDSAAKDMLLKVINAGFVAITENKIGNL